MILFFFLFIVATLLSVHVASGNYADLALIEPQGEGDMQAPPAVGLPQCVKARFALTVDTIVQHQERVVEEDLLGLRRTDAVLFILATVAVVPVETGYLSEIDHGCILLSYTKKAKHFLPGGGWQRHEVAGLLFGRR